MIKIKKFTFNAFQVNTYLLYDESNECVIIDPGCYDEAEKEELTEFIRSNGLIPVRLLNTHSHIDHIVGNRFITEKYTLKLEAHPGGTKFIDHSDQTAFIYGFEGVKMKQIDLHLKEGDNIHFGNSVLEVLETPGHANGSVCFLSREQKFVITGDVLFYQSIGRTDLPDGNYKTLLNSIEQKLLTLDNQYVVYPGHGPETTIGFERMSNPFLAEL